jgi:hypothetical protein
VNTAKTKRSLFTFALSSSRALAFATGSATADSPAATGDNFVLDTTIVVDILRIKRFIIGGNFFTQIDGGLFIITVVVIHLDFTDVRIYESVSDY